MDINESANTPVPADALMSGTGVSAKDVQKPQSLNPIEPRETYMLQVWRMQRNVKTRRFAFVGMTCSNGLPVSFTRHARTVVAQLSLLGQCIGPLIFRHKKQKHRNIMWL